MLFLILELNTPYIVKFFGMSLRAIMGNILFLFIEEQFLRSTLHQLLVTLEFFSL